MARDKRDEVHIDDSFDMVDVAMAMRRLTFVIIVITALVTGDGAAKVCEVVGRCDSLCSDEC